MSNQISILGNLANGVLVMNQEVITFPPNPSPGMLVVNELSTYAYIEVCGKLDWYAIIQRNLKPSNYVGTQHNTSLSWLIQHDLNTINYYYQVQDSKGQYLTPLDIVPVDRNSFRLIFNTPCSGTVLVMAKDNLFIDQLSIGDGSALKITRADQEQLNFVSGVGVTIEFDNITKSLTFNSNATVVLQDQIDVINAAVTNELNRAAAAETNLTNKLNKVIISTGVNSDGSYKPPTTSNYLNNTTSLSGADLILDSKLRVVSDLVNTAITGGNNAVPMSFGDFISGSCTYTDLSQDQVMDSFLITTYRTAKYLIQVSDINGEFQSIELSCMHNGVDTFISDGFDISTIDTRLALFDAKIVSDSFQLIVTPLVLNIVVKFVRTAITV